MYEYNSFEPKNVSVCMYCMYIWKTSSVWAMHVLCIGYNFSANVPIYLRSQSHGTNLCMYVCSCGMWTLSMAWTAISSTSRWMCSAAAATRWKRPTRWRRYSEKSSELSATRWQSMVRQLAYVCMCVLCMWNRFLYWKPLVINYSFYLFMHCSICLYKVCIH